MPFMVEYKLPPLNITVGEYKSIWLSYGPLSIIYHLWNNNPNYGIYGVYIYITPCVNFIMALYNPIYGIMPFRANYNVWP